MPQKVPGKVEIVSELPRTGLGKVAKLALPRGTAEHQGPAVAVGRVADQDPVISGYFDALAAVTGRVGRFPPVHCSASPSTSARDSDTFMHSPLRLSWR